MMLTKLLADLTVGWLAERIMTRDAGRARVYFRQTGTMLLDSEP